MLNFFKFAEEEGFSFTTVSPDGKYLVYILKTPANKEDTLIFRGVDFDGQHVKLGTPKSVCSVPRSRPYPSKNGIQFGENSFSVYFWEANDLLTALTLDENLAVKNSSKLSKNVSLQEYAQKDKIDAKLWDVSAKRLLSICTPNGTGCFVQLPELPIKIHAVVKNRSLLCSRTDKLVVWEEDIFTGKYLRSKIFKAFDEARDVSFVVSHDEKHLLYNSDFKIILYDMTTWEPTGDRLEWPHTQLAISPADSSTIAICDVASAAQVFKLHQ